MTFARWWIDTYRTEEVPKQYFDMMRDAYESGRVDEATVGDEQRHVICICPDCLAGKAMKVPNFEGEQRP